MPERSMITQVVQLGVEATAGTSVAANKRLAMAQISPSIQIETQRFRGSGNKVDSQLAVGKEWIEAGISGGGNYQELPYLYSSALRKATPTQPDSVGFPTVYEWLFTPQPSATDVVQTYSVEVGDANFAEKFAHGVLSAIGRTYNRDSGESGLTGTMVGRALDTSATLTGSPTLLPIQPVVADEVAVYLNDTAAALGTTELTRVVQCGWSVGGRQNPFFVFNRAQSSFTGITEGEIDGTFTVALQADAAGRNLILAMRAEETKFVRMEARGELIGGTHYYTERIDLAGQVESIGDFGDIGGGLYGMEVTFRMVIDPTWANFMQAYIKNTLGAL